MLLHVVVFMQYDGMVRGESGGEQMAHSRRDVRRQPSPGGFSGGGEPAHEVARGRGITSRIPNL